MVLEPVLCYTCTILQLWDTAAYFESQSQNHGPVKVSLIAHHMYGHPKLPGNLASQ